MEPPALNTPPTPPTVGELLRGAWRYLKMAAIIGALVWLPLAAFAWWSGPADSLRHTNRFSFASMPSDLDPLREWIAGQSEVVDVEVETSDDAIEVRYGSASREPLAPPWEQLGYQKPTRTERQWSGKVRITVHHNLGFYLFLLARSLDLGFLIAAIAWLRRARRSGRPLPRLFEGAARPAALWGLGTGLVLAGVAMLYWWLVPQSEKGIAGAWPLTIFWPGWARILSLALVPLVFPLCQELFFRGALLGSFREAGRPRMGLVFSALVFTVAQLNLWEAPVFLVMGLAQAWLYNRTRSLLAPLVAGFVCAALAITLPSVIIGPGLLQELLQQTLEAMQDAGK